MTFDQAVNDHRNAVLEQAAQAVERERCYDGTGLAEDTAYDRAIQHAAEAVRGLKKA